MNPPPNCKSEEKSITFSTHREEKMEAQAGQQQWMMSAQAQPQYAYGAPPPPPPQHYHQPSSHEEIRTLWIGDLPYWADESYLHSWFAATTEVLSIKVIRNKATGISEGYGFLEFASHSTAERALRSYNGTQIPGTELTFWLNWASSGIGERRPDAGPEHSYAYKFGYSEAGTFSYYDYCDDYPIYDQTMGINEYTRQLDVNQRTTSEHTRQNEQLSSSFRANPPECLESNHDAGESLHVWEDNVDLDNMTYEELIELGEIVGSQSRGLSQEAISLLPISKFKCGFFWRNFWKRKSRDERCVICQMEYIRGDRQITLPCTHVYHATCGNQWLTINKVCPICYKDVHVDVSPSKREERFR